MARGAWYRLDNIGKFYASQAGGSRQTVFRYSATLAEDVDPEALQRALERTCELFPSFNVCLRSGLFWHYLEPSGQTPRALPEELPVCLGLHANTRSVLFRTVYFGPRLSVEVSHIVSDGRGTLMFFKTLLGAYLAEAHGIEGLEPDGDASEHEKAEDSFDKYFERDKAGSTRLPRAWRLRGWQDVTDPSFMELHLPAGEVVALARSWGVSVTSLVCGVLIASLRDEMRARDLGRAICLDVPVDLRGHFGSATSKNFFGLAYVTYVPAEHEGGAEGPQGIAEKAHAQLKAAVDPEHLKLRMNRMVALEKNPALRFAPLFVKDLVLEAADRLAARDTTATVSNLGVVRLDPRVAPYVRDVDILTSTTGLKLTMCSLGDDMSVGFASAYRSHDVVKRFCRFFTGRGMAARMNVSRSAAELEEDEARARRKALARGGGKEDGA